MKVLMVGMDGGHVDIFHRGWTPYVTSLIEKGESLAIKNDLKSRGWLEIVTGKHGIDTGALYDKPKANGSNEWNLKFNIQDIPGLGKTVKPLWQVLSEKGVKVGIMNVPTVYPAPEVNGFFVSGGGGGAPVVQTPTENYCYPRDEVTSLLKRGYIVDERVVSLMEENKITDIAQMFEIFNNKNSKRTESFIHLAKKHQIDFGFVVYKSSSNLAEWLLLPEWKRQQEGGKDIDVQFIDTIKHYYCKFDEEICKLHKEFPDAQIIFVSDHSMTTREWSINPNILLQENGYQSAPVNKRLLKKITTGVKNIIPFSWRVALRKKPAVNKAYFSIGGFDYKTSLAFSRTEGDWAQGIYINDKGRFGGPVEESEIKPLIAEIILAINSHHEAKKHGIRAIPKIDSASPAASFFPDIMIDSPEGYLTTDQTKLFVERFTPPKGPLNLLSITKGNLLCMKSHYPIALICNGEWRTSPQSGYPDLTAVYEHIIAVFEEKSSLGVNEDQGSSA